MNKEMINEIVSWIKNYIESAHANGVVIGMSGGKDSLVVAKLCSLALGNDKVYGVIMPNGLMSDKNDAVKTCELLKIPYTTINIENSYNDIISTVKHSLNQIKVDVNEVTTINTAPRIRMTTLYAIAGSLNYLVANTSNLSEISVGYSTKWGDGVGDFAPIANLTKTEVCELGLMLDLPEYLVNKMPSDGLSGKSDEDKLGFSYNELDTFIRTGVKGDKFDIIERKHRVNAHKRNSIPKFESKKPNYFDK
jgi:NAD+ synthase